MTGKVLKINSLRAYRVEMPEAVGDRLNKFLLDKSTGNLTVHVCEGRIVSLKIEEHVRA